MQSWKFNSIARSVLIDAIAASLKIPHSEVYKIIREIGSNFIKTKDGKIYKVILEEI
jgi:hypothetical protein